jgi:hypothetical protein
MKKGLIIIILSLIVKSSFGQEFTDFYGDYLGQTPPGDTPVVFAPGIVSDKYQQHGAPSFSPDGNVVFWQTNQQPINDSGKWISNSMIMRRIGNRWTKPEVSPYGSMPFFSTDGNRIYFADTINNSISFVEKQGNLWSEPKKLGIDIRFPELKNAFFPSIARNGTIYFMGYAKEPWNDNVMYRTELINGEYAKPELLPPSINAPGGMRNWSPFIAPDESYLIFCSTRGLSQYDQGDLFISFRKPDGSWMEPINMGDLINTNQMERFSRLSPDGKYLFFTRDVLPDYWEDVFWVSAKIIDRLREKSNMKK